MQSIIRIYLTTEELSPAIVVEIYIRLIDIHKDEDFVTDVCTCIKGAIKDHILAQRDITDQKYVYSESIRTL